MLQNPLIPLDKREDLISHIVLVHQSVGVYSARFLSQLRRANYVTPKNYLDYIGTYLKLLRDKDKYIEGLVSKDIVSFLFAVIYLLNILVLELMHTC